MNIKTIILLTLITISIACKKDNQSTEVALFYSRCQSTLDSIYTANPTASGIMLHIESPKNNLSWSGCTGYSDKDEKIRLVSDQPALIASSIKPFVSASILRLEELKKLTIDDAIGRYLTDKTTRLFEGDGYDLEAIKIKHLLAHISGIYNYADAEYLDMIQNDKQHRWTREEQLLRSIEMGDPLSPPADTFVYADANFLLATEIIETITELPFYTAMRKLLKYEELGFEDTWFPTLEKPNPATKSLVHQYWSSRGWDSYDIDPSFDLYGGGGIATTTQELTQFFYNLFQGNIIRDSTTLNKIFTKIIPPGEEDNGYCLGLGEDIINGHRYYWHGGFWGTNVMYFPELETSIAIYVLEKDKSQMVYNEIPGAIVEKLAKQLNRK